MSEERMTFILEGKELATVKKWRKSHQCKPDAQRATDGADFTYRFTPGGLGTAVVVTCRLCGQSENVTNFDVW